MLSSKSVYISSHACPAHTHIFMNSHIDDLTHTYVIYFQLHMFSLTHTHTFLHPWALTNNPTYLPSPICPESHTCHHSRAHAFPHLCSSTHMFLVTHTGFRHDHTFPDPSFHTNHHLHMITYMPSHVHICLNNPIHDYICVPSLMLSHNHT